MKNARKFTQIVVLMMVFVLALSACAQETAEEPAEATKAETTEAEATEEPVVKEVEEYSQGVTDTTILVGNTAAVSGALAVVGVPFNDAIMAYFKMVNDAGGIGGKQIEFVTYDDGFDGATGAALTEN